MNRRRKPARRLLLGRLRSVAQSWALFAGAVALAGLVAGSLFMHRLDSLSKQRVELEAEVASARHALDRVRAELARDSAYEVVVRRAKSELRLVECAPAAQLFLAMPRDLREPGSTNWIADLAARVDRFANVRDVFAAEKDRR